MFYHDEENVKINIKRSNHYKERAKKIIPSLTGTFSRSPSSFVEGVYPVYAQSASGSHFTDVDGNNFLDYLCGLGPITLGYNYKRVNDAVIKQLTEGMLFSLPHPIEVEISELMCDIIPNAEKSGYVGVSVGFAGAEGELPEGSIALAVDPSYRPTPDPHDNVIARG